MELENYLKGKTIESVKETENGLEIVFKEDKFVPKHGEFYKCVFKDGTFEVGIFGTMGGGLNPIFDSFCSYLTGERLYPMLIAGGNIVYGFLHKIKEFVDPTQEEKDLLFDLLAKDGKRWNAEKKQIEKIRWRAKGGETYYFVDFVQSIACVLSSTEAKFISDEKRYYTGNYFQTKEQSQAVADRINAIFDENL